MKKLNAKRLAALAMTLVMLLGVLTACGDKADTNNGSGDGEGFPTMTIQIAHVNPTTDDDQYNKLATLFAEKVTAATDGAVTFEICGNSELGGEADVLTGFDLGTHQMGIITNGSYGNLYGPSLVVELPIASAYTGSYYEICDYYDMTGHFYNAISLSCSKSFWESLSPELQEIFLTAAKEAGAEQRTWLQTAAADMLSKMEDGGCTIIDDVDVAAFQEACAPVYEAYRDKIGSDLLDRAVAAVQ